MTCTGLFEVCQQSQWADKESRAKVEQQQRTRALFNALLMHSRPGWNVLKALKKSPQTVKKSTIHMLWMDTGKLIIDVHRGHTFTASQVNIRKDFA